MDDVMFGRNGPYGGYSGFAIPGRSLTSMNAVIQSIVADDIKTIQLI